MEKWFKAHGFRYIKINDNHYFWQTAVATGEVKDKKITWHEKDFFEKVLDNLSHI